MALPYTGKKRGRKTNIYKGQQVVENKFGKTIELSPVEPHCNCKGVYKYHDKKITRLVRELEAHCHVTKSSDKETCDFCGYYVSWKVEGNRNQKRGKYKKKGKK